MSQKKRLLKAKIAVALYDELGRVPKKEEIEQVTSEKTIEESTPTIEESTPISVEEAALREALDGALCLVAFSAQGMKAFHLADNAQDPEKADPDNGKFLIYRDSVGGAVALGSPRKGISFKRKLGGLIHVYYQPPDEDGPTVDPRPFGRG